MAQYPKWVYASGGRSVMTTTRDQHLKLGDGWYESPADVPVVTIDHQAVPLAAGALSSAVVAVDQLLKKFWNSPVGPIVQCVRVMTNVAELEDLLLAENQRTAGPRIGVTKAITEALDSLKSATEGHVVSS